MSHPRRCSLRVFIGAAALLGVVSTSAVAGGAHPIVGMRRARVSADNVSAPSDQGNVALTLDPHLQNEVEGLLRASHAREAGAIVIEVQTGRILAWVSVDPAGRDMVSHPYAPPASLFKVVTATALLDRANVPVQARQCFVGGERAVRLSDLRSNGAGPGVRCETLETALGYSRNLVVAGLARRHLDADTLEDTARNLGLGAQIPMDVQVEKGSIDVPSDEAGLAKTAAGFGPGHMSPLQAAYMMTIIARGGIRPVLSLLNSSTHSFGSEQGQAMKPSTAHTLARMLEVTVREGTCARAFRDERGRLYLGSMRIAAKTGTLAKADPTRLYSWFSGFAPSDRPQVAVAVMLANEPRWWQKGNQVGRDILRAYFGGTSHRTASRRAR